MSLLAVTTFLLSVDKLTWILFGIIVLFSIIFYKMQFKSSTFDFKEIFIANDSGTVSLNKVGQFVALVFSSWGFVYLVMHNSLSEMYFTGYMTVWAGVNIINNGITAYNNKPVASAATVTSSVTSGKTQ